RRARSGEAGAHRRIAREAQRPGARRPALTHPRARRRRERRRAAVTASRTGAGARASARRQGRGRERRDAGAANDRERPRLSHEALRRLNDTLPSVMYAGRMMNFPLTLTHLLERARRHYGRNEVVSRAPDGTLHRHTWGDAYARSAKLAHALARLGVQR